MERNKTNIKAELTNRNSIEKRAQSKSKESKLYGRLIKVSTPTSKRGAKNITLMEIGVFSNSPKEKLQAMKLFMFLTKDSDLILKNIPRGMTKERGCPTELKMSKMSTEQAVRYKKIGNLPQEKNETPRRCHS